MVIGQGILRDTCKSVNLGTHENFNNIIQDGVISDSWRSYPNGEIFHRDSNMMNKENTRFSRQSDNMFLKASLLDDDLELDPYDVINVVIPQVIFDIFI